MRNFKTLDVWQLAHEVVLDIYNLSTSFPKTEMYGVTSQIRRAAASVATNIAEGAGTVSKKEFARYLHISLASASETEYLLLLCRDLGYIAQNDFEKNHNAVTRIKNMLISFSKRLRS